VPNVQLLEDPEIARSEYGFSRILGNTGKAGFSILTSPSELMVSKLDPRTWRVESTVFDGARLDSFGKTSLHLNFTDWQAPVVQFQSVGQRDSDVNILEAVVSVRDSGKWIADVDIYRALYSDRLRRYNQVCSHDYAISESSGLLSVETWDQVLDRPDGSVVVRCFDNWVARLAIVSVLCQHSSDTDRQIVICSKTACWKCNTQPCTSDKDMTYIY
jgi:hypothetical protein